MNMHIAAAFAAVSLFTAPAAAAVTTLTFEGIANGAPVGAFYAPDYIFSAPTLALVDSDAGGGGSFANEPSPNTIMYFTDANSAVLDVPGGFTTGFSFFYTSAVAATVTVYDGPGATGNVLGVIDLVAQYTDNCSGDPGGDFCNWSASGVSFGGTALSIDFAGATSVTGFDNITFGSESPVIPEPVTWTLLIVGFGLVGTAARRQRRIRAAA
jgi:hypothetical protein